MHAATIYAAGGDDKLMFFFTGVILAPSRHIVEEEPHLCLHVSVAEKTLCFSSLLCTLRWLIR